MKEENVEYLVACGEGNLTEIADALGDQLYILLGTIIKHGMQDVIADVFREIHDSNMTKLGEDGLPILREDGKILKGPNYRKPNIQQFFDNEHS
jgi:predicted HAD superfamily Cof-like phosphohydrolase